MIRDRFNHSWLLAIPLLLFGVGVVPAAAADLPVFRVTEYEVGSDEFRGKTFDLTLDQPLVSDHFILVRGASDGDKTRGADDSYARVAALPAGVNGELPAASDNLTVTLERHGNRGSWRGVVKVVECLAKCDSEGFRRRDVLALYTPGAEVSGQITAQSWQNVEQVVPFGGAFGAGSSVLHNGSGGSQKYTSAWVRLVPSGNSAIDWNRLDGGSRGLTDAMHTVYIVEWGTEWHVQRVLASGSAGGNGVDAPGEYDTFNIDPVERDSTWLWATGMSSEDGIGDGAEGTIVTLGNGVDTQPVESTVAMGGEYPQMRHFAVYLMSNNSLITDHLFKPDGNKSDLEYDLGTLSAGTEKMAWVLNTMNGTGNAFPRPIFSSRYLAADTIRLRREYQGQDFAAWVQGIDFSAITYTPGFLGVDIIDSFGNSLQQALFSLSPVAMSLWPQTAYGDFGDNDHRIRVTNTTSSPRWSLALAAQNGSGALWQGEGGNRYDFNDPTADVLDGADADGFGGQMTVDPVAMTIFPQFGCAPAGIIRGIRAAFTEGATDAITLLTADDTAPTGCTWDIMNIGVEQTIPAEQPVDSYSIDMVLTLTAY